MIFPYLNRLARILQKNEKNPKPGQSYEQYRREKKTQGKNKMA